MNEGVIYSCLRKLSWFEGVKGKKERTDEGMDGWLDGACLGANCIDCV
jgi:hypothetical protein